MEIRSNESTELRPDGTRIMDAPLVRVDLLQFMKQLKVEVTWQTSDRNAITVFKTNGMCIVLIALHQGAVMKEHTTDEVISVQVLNGEINFSSNSESMQLISGDMIALRAGVPHSVEAIKESVFLLTITSSQEV